MMNVVAMSCRSCPSFFASNDAEILSQPVLGDETAIRVPSRPIKGRVKLSTGKPILPGRKQVFRIEENGHAVRDVIARADEHLDGRPLLHPVMAGSCRTARGAADLEGARAHAREELRLLPDPVRALAPADPAVRKGRFVPSRIS